MMKQGRLINFELLWDTDIEVNNLLPKILEKDFQQAAFDGIDTIIGTFLLEGVLPYDTDNIYNKILFLEIKKLSDKYNLEVIILSGLGENFQRNKMPFKVIYTPYHLRISFNILSSINGNVEYNANDKFLFLGGVPTRMNRIYLLSKLYEQDLLLKGEWSFFIPSSQEDQDYCRNLLSHYSDIEYNNFLKKCTRSIDNKYQGVIKFLKDYAPYKQGDFEEWSKIVHTDFWKNPVYIDPEIYNRTSLSIISEGINFWSDDYDFITEKLWRAIIYKHPFIFAGHPDQFKYVKRLGFETFEKYMLVKDYAYTHNEKERIDLIVKNIDHFLTNQKRFQKELEHDISDNYNLFLKLANDQSLLLRSLKIEYNISDAEFAKFFDTHGWENLVRPIDDALGLI